MNTPHTFIDEPHDEQFDLPNLLYAAASALIPYLAALLLVLLGWHPS